ncbi:MAG: COX15/CtaA family protein [Pseudomonadales bacterium]
MQKLLVVLMMLVLATNLLSAWLRHREAGVGCTPWPACYAVLDPAAVGVPAQPVAAALRPEQAIKQAHRTIAAALVVLVVLVLHQARTLRHTEAFDAVLPYALAAVTLLLAVVGPASFLKTRPGIAASNVLGGMLMLAICWRMLLAVRASRPMSNPSVPRMLVLAALVAVSVQVTLGAWISANFAATVCERALGCAAPGPGDPSADAFWYLRELELDAAARVVPDANTWLIQHAHRLGAWVAAGLAVTLGGLLLRRRVLPVHGLLLITGVATQLALGLILVTRPLPMPAVLAHLLLATVLLLTLIDLSYRSRPSVAS